MKEVTATFENVPEDAIIGSAVCVVEFITAEGSFIAVANEGELTRSGFVGLMEVGKLHLYAQTPRMGE